MNLIKHIQFQQLFNLILLVSLGYLNSRLQTNFFTIFLLMAYSGALELILKKDMYIPYSAFITALGVVLMVGWLGWYIPYIVITLAILQKLYIKIDGKHIFNPSNFALILAIFIFYPKALPIIGELGKESYVLYIVIALGATILIRVNRYLISISFIVSYIVLNYLIMGSSNPTWSFEHFEASLYSISFMVYIFFMLTDPITTPNGATAQIVFAFLVALLIVALNYIIGERVWHLFIALFLISVAFIPFYRDLTKDDYKRYLFILILSLFIVVSISLKKPLYFSM